MPILLKLFQNTEKAGTLPNSFHEASTAYTRANKDTTRKLQASVPLKKDAKILNETAANPIEQHTERIIVHDQVGFIPGTQDGST